MIKKSFFLLTLGYFVFNSWGIASSTTEQTETSAEHAKKPKTAAGTKQRPSDDKALATLPDFTAVVQNVIGSVVSIAADQEQPSRKDEMDQFSQQFKGTPFEDFFRNFLGRENAPRRVHVGGSGFVIQVKLGECIFIVTNSHVVENAVRAKIFLNDKTDIPATVHGIDPRTDLAVLKVEWKDLPKEKQETIKALSWGDSSSTEVGQWVLAFGNPFGLGNTVTAGIVSAKGRDLNTGGSTLTDDYLQHSAPINMGNSGGCLVNTRGQVIGINTVIVTPSGGNVGIGLAITSNNARKTIEQLILHKEIQHGALGVTVQDFKKEDAEALDLSGYKSGAIVNALTKDGPAEKAGVKKGDIIVQFDETPIQDRVRLSRLVSEASVNTVHTLTVIRGRKILKIKVKLGDFDALNGGNKRKKIIKKEAEERPIEILGMTLRTPDEVANSSQKEDERTDRGALVVKVKPNSPADDISIIRDDLIVEVNQSRIASAQDFVDAVVTASKNGKRFVYLRVRNNGVDRFILLRIDDDQELKKLCEEKQASTSDKTTQQKEQKKNNTATKQENESTNVEEVTAPEVKEEIQEETPSVEEVGEVEVVPAQESEPAEVSTVQKEQAVPQTSKKVAPTKKKKGVWGFVKGLFGFKD